MSWSGFIDRMKGRWGAWFDRAALAGIVWGIYWMLGSVGQLVTWQAAQNERWTALQIQLASLYRADIAKKDMEVISARVDSNAARIDGTDTTLREHDKRIEALERRIGR